MRGTHQHTDTFLDSKFWPALAYGALSGARATSGPVFVSRYLSARPVPGALAASPLRALAQPGVTTALRLLMGGELVGDKLPASPDRTVPQQLTGRSLMGALAGATWYKAQGGRALAGALVGAAGALAATYLTFWLRQAATDESGLPSAVTGAGEDALVVAVGRALSA